MQTTVTADYFSQQLLLFDFAVCQRQTAVTAYFLSQQLVLFDFARHNQVKKQTAVTGHSLTQQLLLFTFTGQLGALFCQWAPPKASE